MGLVRSAGLGGQATMGTRIAYSVMNAATLAHEIGHNFGRLHATPCVGTIAFSDPLYPHADGTIGTWRWDRRTGALVSAKAPPTSDPPTAYTAATPVVSEWPLVAPTSGRTRTVLKAVGVLTVGPCLLWYSWRFSPLLALFAWWGLMAPLGMAVASLWTVAFKAANSTPLTLSLQVDVPQTVGIARPTSRKSTSRTRSRRRNRSETWWDAYPRYRRSRHWQQVRARVVKRDEGRCQECGASGNEVHHVRYTAAHRKRNFKNQPLENLVLLCGTCHRTRHAHEF